ncbi:MAG: hypothetical protein K2J04_11175 [Lachnospiraceae bacterium]|nr:hypothetical protein [Lachnospiraceae bacterium]
MKYYDFRWSDERMITGIGEAAEYDICRMIVGIHRAYSIFLSYDEIRKNERSRRYKQLLVSETIEKIKLRFYGSVYFRKNMLFHGEEFLYYPLPYELFVLSTKMGQMLMDGHTVCCGQLYYGVIYNGYSALSLLEGNLFGTAYPLCRGAIEMYLKLLLLNTQTKFYDWYEKFRMFEVEYSCSQTYPEGFNALFEKRVRQDLKARADYLHFGWVDFIDGYHKAVKKFPYSIYGIITYFKDKNKTRILELEQLGDFYKSCHAYTHGSIQTAIYPLLHYFEISIMLYHVIRGTFLLMCREKGVEALVDGNDVISMIDRDFEVLHEQYKIQSTEMFERAKNEGL